MWPLRRRTARAGGTGGYVRWALALALALTLAPGVGHAQDAAVTAPSHALEAGAPGAPDASIAQPVSREIAPAAVSTPTPLPPVGAVARVVLGLVALLTLSLLAGHPAVGRFERRAGLAMFVATGMPFLALGLLAHLPAVGVLSDATLSGLRPLLEFGLGWIGFRVGTGFDVRELDRLPAGTGRLVAMESGGAFLAAGLASLGALSVLTGRAIAGHTGDLVRDAVVLAACAAVSAPSGARALEAARVIDARMSRWIRRVAVLDNAVPVAVLGVVTSFFRPLGDVGRWQLPAIGWLFLQIGMGATLGLLTASLRRAARSSSEQVAFTLGAIAFASGAAGYLGFSPLAVGCVAGMVAVNVSSMRGAGDDPVSEQLRDLERPIYLVFFAIAGATWDVTDWRGWAIVPLFALARLLGKLLGARAGLASARIEARTRAAYVPTAPAYGSFPPPSPEQSASWPAIDTLSDMKLPGLALVPTGAVSIAVIVAAQQSYAATTRPYLPTVVIIGAIVAELVFQLRVPAAPPTPVRP